MKYIWPKKAFTVKLRVLTAIILLAGSKILNVEVPLIFKNIVDTLNISNPDILISIPISLILGYGIARAGSSLFNELKSAVFSNVAQRAIRYVACNTFYHLLNLDLKFHLERQSGALSRALERGSRGINFILTAMVFNIIPTLLEIFLVCGILYSNFGIEYALVTLSTMITYTAYTLIVTQWRTKFRKQMNTVDNEAAGKALDSLLNFETVKYFNNEKMETENYNELLKQYDIAALKSQSSLALLNFGQSFIFTCSLTAFMFMAANGIKNRTMSIGDLVMINGLLFQLSMPLNFLGTVYREIRQSLIDMESMFQLLSTQPVIKDIPNAKPLIVKRGCIEFSNITFGYKEEKDILKAISFIVKPGQKVALVGQSGSGKSTILRLLFRFYEPKEGIIKIDDQDIQKVTLESLRKNIAVIPQETTLFNNTILYNIKYGNPSASYEEIIEAAKRAHIHDQILQMPDGYQTIVGERGLKLSGGEKQRISIARAILKNSPILFFDEATSAVDSTTEENIQSSLKNLFGNYTSIHIAHRLSTIIDADEIIVLGKDGTIIEKGTHEELLKINGTYKTMWEKQKKQQ